MKRVITGMCIAAVAVILGGCTAPPGPIAPRASLLFDPLPGVYQPQEFAARPDWPTAPSFFDDGEAVYYREYFYDRQGSGFHHQDYFSRRFSQVRKGRGHR